MNNAIQPRQKSELIFGTRAVIEAIVAGQSLAKVFLDLTAKNPLQKELLTLLRQYQIPFSRVPAAKLHRMTRKNHQGVVALLAPIHFAQLNQIIPACYEQGKVPLVLLLDHITDVRNFGAIVRTAACTGVAAIVVPTSGSVAIGGDAMKTSAGALAHVPVCRVPDLKTEIKYLQESGLQVMALHEKAAVSIYEADLSVPMGLLLGSEEKGIAPVHLKMVDCSLHIPMSGPIGALNVSVAAGIALYESVRQRNL